MNWKLCLVVYSKNISQCYVWDFKTESSANRAADWFKTTIIGADKITYYVYRDI